MHALAGQGIEVGRENGHEGLALAGLHLGDAALMQDDAAQQLHRVGALAQHPVGGFAHGGEGLGQDVVQRLARGQPPAEALGLAAQFGVGHGFILPLEGFNLRHDGTDGLQLPLGAGAEDFGDNGREQTHVWSPFGAADRAEMACSYSIPYLYRERNKQSVTNAGKDSA